MSVRQFELTGRMKDLDEAIRKTEQAAEATPIGHPNLPGRFNNLIKMLHMRFERTGGIKDIEEADRKAEQAIKATLKGHQRPSGFSRVAEFMPHAFPLHRLWVKVRR
jgi:hypothetical protein